MALDLARIRRLADEFADDPAIPAISDAQATAVLHVLGGQTRRARRIMRQSSAN